MSDALIRDVRFRLTAGLALCLMLVSGPAWAQDPGGRQAGGTAYYTFARPGQNTIEVLVLGGGQSGIYEIGENIDLGQLIALAGGGGGGGRRSKIKVHFFRVEGGERRKVFEEEIGKFASRSQYPSLQDGDVVRIETNQRFDWRDGLRISTTLLGLATTLLTIFDVGGN